MMYAANNDQCPGYIGERLIALSSLISRSRLRSTSSIRYKVPRTQLKFEDRAFSMAGHIAWNSLQKKINSYLA